MIEVSYNAFLRNSEKVFQSYKPYRVITIVRMLNIPGEKPRTYRLFSIRNPRKVPITTTMISLEEFTLHSKEYIRKVVYKSQPVLITDSPCGWILLEPGPDSKVYVEYVIRRVFRRYQSAKNKCSELENTIAQLKESNHV